MGYSVEFDGEDISIFGKASVSDIDCVPYFSVTATENMIMANVWRQGKTTIRLAAIEPHVMNLIETLRAMGADIAVGIDHTITIFGKEIDGDKTFEAEVIHDYIESGTFAVAGALAAKDFIDIRNARVADLSAFLFRLSGMGVRYEVLPGDMLRVYRAERLVPPNPSIQTNIYPGFPTDLQSVFAILLTQAEGTSRIQEVLFEGRLNWLVELEKMKGHVAILNPHEAFVFGPTHLRGTTVSSWDLRAGVAMILAGLIAQGETFITNVEYIERGYEDIVGKFRGLGVNIERIIEPAVANAIAKSAVPA